MASRGGGVLAGMLLSALANAKDRAKAIQCLNNARQLGLATARYTGDRNDLYPYGVNVKNDATWSDPTAWHILLLTCLAGNTNKGAKVYACPSDVEGARQTYPLPPGNIRFQMSYRANAYMFRTTTAGEKTALRATAVPSPSTHDNRK